MEAQTTYDARVTMVSYLFQAQKAAGLCYGTDSYEYRELERMYKLEAERLTERQEEYAEARRMFLVIKKVSDKMGEEEDPEDLF